MKAVLYGSTGRAGSRILRELLKRNHEVLAITREPGALKGEGRLATAVDDLSDVSRTAEIIKGAEAVISAYAPPPDNTDALLHVTKLLVEAVSQSGVARLLMVGDGGSLEVSPGVSLQKSGSLPPEWLAISASHGKALDVLRSSTVDWTYLSPGTYFEPGERTGLFRLGKDNLIANEKGESRISMEDYAMAMVDELEKAKHIKQRFSVGYRKFAGKVRRSKPVESVEQRPELVQQILRHEGTRSRTGSVRRSGLSTQM